MSPWTAVGLLVLAVWLYLITARGGFWLARERDDGASPPPPGRWPCVVAVVPARNEADVIEQSIGSLLRQDYPGLFRIVLVDDGSSDGTAAVAVQASNAVAAGGGCILVRSDALERAGGIVAIRSEIIDDCALARRLKRQGPIWLGLTRRVASLRSYGGFLKIGGMISRSAYAQLGYSPVVLAGTVVAMVLLYPVPFMIA